MTILVAYASKHGATRGIAERIAQTLRELNYAADLVPVNEVKSLDAYDAVVLGSAVYYGSWLKDAAEFAQHNRAALAQRPVWLFSSGPLGAEVHDSEEQPKEIGELQAAIGARGHRIFFGALDPHALSFPERMVIKAVRAPDGDYRDWEAIAAWATDVAHALASAESQSTHVASHTS